MRCTFSLTGIVVALSIFPFPEADPGQPDFSGRWELDAVRSEGVPAETKQSMTVKHTGNRLEVQTKITGPQQERTVNDIYTLDGKPAKFTPALLAGGKAKNGTRTASWSADGSGMDVLEQADVETAQGADTIKGKRTWRLSEGGKVLTIEIDLAGETGPIKGKRVYQKR
jgi:hypothetical protein